MALSQRRTLAEIVKSTPANQADRFGIRIPVGTLSWRKVSFRTISRNDVEQRPCLSRKGMRREENKKTRSKNSRFPEKAVWG